MGDILVENTNKYIIIGKLKNNPNIEGIMKSSLTCNIAVKQAFTVKNNILISVILIRGVNISLIWLSWVNIFAIISGKKLKTTKIITEITSSKLIMLLANLFISSLPFLSKTLLSIGKKVVDIASPIIINIVSGTDVAIL